MHLQLSVLEMVFMKQSPSNSVRIAALDGILGLQYHPDENVVLSDNTS
jgi:hypothetical protein